jgi:zinc transporter, ZIP family
VIEAGFWGLAAAAGLLVGAAAAAVRIGVAPRVIGLAAGFGAGVLVSAFDFVLDEKAYELGGAAVAILGLVGGALLFFLAGRSVDRRGLAPRKVLDAVPESMAIALTLVEDNDIGGAIVAAVFLSNIAEALTTGAGPRLARGSRESIPRLWATVAIAAAVTAAVTYGLLQSASDTLVATTQAAAIGAVLCMTFETLVPVAFANASRALGLVTVIGFGVGFALSLA